MRDPYASKAAKARAETLTAPRTRLCDGYHMGGPCADELCWYKHTIIAQREANPEIDPTP